MIEISIIIINFNTKDLLVSCLNSVLISSPKVKYEIIIVDNGSTDGSVEAVEKFKKKNINIIQNENNYGFAKANNQGIKKASSKYILLLNSDTYVKKETIDKMYEFAKKTSDAGVIGAKLLNPNGTSQASCFRFPSYKNAINQYWFGKERLLDKYFPSGDQPSEVDAVVGAAFLITPQALKKVGLLDEKYFFFYEDLDYCRRVSRVGLKVYFLPSALVVHHHGSTVSKINSADKSWEKLIPGSKIYNGLIKHYLINFIIRSAHIWQKIKL